MQHVGRDEFAALQEQLARQRKELDQLRGELEVQKALNARPANEFVVAQYNILAGYLGDNRQPWFLYGVELDAKRRDAIVKKFYERDADGQLVNVGWPNYVNGLLSDEEQAAICQVQERCFAWEVRRPKLLAILEQLEADLLSVVECDHFDDTFRPALAARGYGALWKKRPRASSSDGCAIFYKRGVFQLEAHDAVEFVDRANGKARKDRVCLMALLTHRTGKQIIFISAHLARNPEDPRQLSTRAKQTAQLLFALTKFAARHDASHVPVVLAGDLNTTNIRHVANVTRVAFELGGVDVHPFLFTASALRSPPTTVTTMRKMCIDYLFLQQSSLLVLDHAELPSLSRGQPIPNELHPSDHLPIAYTLAFRRSASQTAGFARTWAGVILTAAAARTTLRRPTAAAEPETVSDPSFARPLTRDELDKAHSFFDVNGDGNFGMIDLKEGLASLELSHQLRPLVAALNRVTAARQTSALVEDGTWRRRDQQQSAPELGASISFEAFCDAYLASFRSLKSQFTEEIAQAFNFFTADSCGEGERANVTCDQLYEALQEFVPFDIDRESFAATFAAIDESGNNDGSISSDEFVAYLLKSAHTIARTPSMRPRHRKLSSIIVAGGPRPGSMMRSLRDFAIPLAVGVALLAVVRRAVSR